MSYTRLSEQQLMDGIAANSAALEAAHKYQTALANRQALPANEAARGALTSSNTRAIEMLEGRHKGARRGIGPAKVRLITSASGRHPATAESARAIPAYLGRRNIHV